MSQNSYFLKTFSFQSLFCWKIVYLHISPWQHNHLHKNMSLAQYIQTVTIYFSIWHTSGQKHRKTNPVGKRDLLFLIRTAYIPALISTYLNFLLNSSHAIFRCKTFFQVMCARYSVSWACMRNCLFLWAFDFSLANLIQNKLFFQSLFSWLRTDL